MKQRVIERSGQPQRLITKKQGLRHIIHAAIRLTFFEEDPFAIHLLGQSAEKVCLDLLKRNNLNDPFPLDKVVKSAYRAEFFEIYRQPYNFLKHADRDHDGELPIYNLVSSNDFLVFECLLRYVRLFEETTAHMNCFQWLFMALYPNLFHWEKIPLGPELLKMRSTIKSASRGDLLTVSREMLEGNQDYLKERELDLADTREASELLLESVNDGRKE